MPRAYFVCTYENCSATFRRSEPYDNHLRKHKNERPFICSYDDCDKSYSRLAHLKRHEETHESMYRCDYPNCNKILISKVTLQKHVDVVHLKKKPKTYKCSQCDQEFNKHNWLTAHMYSHTGVKPYECPEADCDRRFLRPSKLKRHLKYHKGYPCTKENCNETFSKWSLLRNHIKECHPPSHKCPSCDQVFSSTTNLKQHSVVHMEERELFKCPVPKCIRFCHAKRHLAEHLKNFHEKRSYSCPKEDCHIFCKTEEDLAKHIMRRHMPRHRKPIHPKPSFAEIIAGFAKGTRKDLDPHLHTTNKSDEPITDMLESTLIEDIDSEDTNVDINDISSAQNYTKHLNSCLFNTPKLDETQKQLLDPSLENSVIVGSMTTTNQNQVSNLNQCHSNASKSRKTNRKVQMTNNDVEDNSVDGVTEILTQNYVPSDAWINNFHAKNIMCNVLV